MKNSRFVRELLTSERSLADYRIEKSEAAELDNLFFDFCETPDDGALDLVIDLVERSHSRVAAIAFDALRIGFPSRIADLALRANGFYKLASSGRNELRFVITAALFKAGVPLEKPLSTDEEADGQYDRVFLPVLKDVLLNGRLSSRDKEDPELAPLYKKLAESVFWYTQAAGKLRTNRPGQIAALIRDLHKESKKSGLSQFMPHRYPYVEGVIKLLVGGAASHIYLPDAMEFFSDNKGVI